MEVVGLFTKPIAGAEMVARDQLSLVKGFGIKGDSNGCVGSPRQVLLADQPTLHQFGLRPGQLWENILVDAPVQALQSGRVIKIGTALLRPTFPCEPCDRLNLRYPSLAKQIGQQRGFLAMVVEGGVIQLGDCAIPSSLQLPSLSQRVRDRFNEFVARIPPGRIVTTADLVLALGVDRSYYRVIPTLIKKSPAHLPVHRIVAIDGSLVTRHIPDQSVRLAEEGVGVDAGKVSDRHRWQPEHFHAYSSP
jgi:alkylated DNA nucleotide flippase Atl1